MTNLRRFAGTYDKLLREKYRPHNPKVVGSNPAPATTHISLLRTSEVFGGAFFLPKTGSLSTFCQKL